MKILKKTMLPYYCSFSKDFMVKEFISSDALSEITIIQVCCVVITNNGMSYSLNPVSMYSESRRLLNRRIQRNNNNLE